MRWPDYVINVGGAIVLNYLEAQQPHRGHVDAVLARIGDTLTEVCARSEQDGTTTAELQTRSPRPGFLAER